MTKITLFRAVLTSLKGFTVKLFPKNRRVLANHNLPSDSPSDASTVMVFANEGKVAPITVNQLDDAGMARVEIPYGESSHHSQKYGLNKQAFSRDDAVVLANSFKYSIVRRILGLPFYVGHPDVEEFREKYPDQKAVGRIKSIEVGETAMFANVKFNEAGQSIIRQEEFEAYSPTWETEKGSDGAWHPVVLRSIGFTNQPNLPVKPILANEEATQNDNDMDKEKLAPLMAALIKAGLLKEDADDDALVAALTGLLPEPESKADETDESKEADEADVEMEAKLKEAEDEAEKVKQTLANERLPKITAAVDGAITSGHVLTGKRDETIAGLVVFANEVNADLDKKLATLIEGEPKMKVAPGASDLGSRDSNEKSLRVLANEYLDAGTAKTWDAAWELVRDKHPERFPKRETT